VRARGPHRVDAGAAKRKSTEPGVDNGRDQAAAHRTLLAHKQDLVEAAAPEPNESLDNVLAKLQAASLAVPELRPTHAIFEAVKLDESCLGPKGRLLGKGGFGEMRESTCFGVPVAVKYLPYLGPRDLKNVRMEVTAMARLRHPNVCECLGIVVAEEYCAIVLELLPAGSTLYDKLPEMWWAERVRAAVDVARAVAYLHAKQVIHNDLKAANAIVAADGTVKLIDFGLAESKATRTRMTGVKAVAGTMLWMAPELLWHGKPEGDYTTDVYSLGMVLIELMTGDVPYGRRTPAAIALQRAQQGILPACTVDPALELHPHEAAAVDMLKGIIADCLSAKFTARPTAAAVHERLLQVRSVTPGQREEGVALMRETLEMRRRLYRGIDHPHVLRR
jgi:serine/threonine protein kinase